MSQCNIRPAGYDAAIISALPYLQRYASGLCKNSDTAMDLVNDTVVKALAAYAQFQEGTNLLGWLTVICRNSYFASARRSKRNPVDADAPDLLTLLASTPASQHGVCDLANTLSAINGLPQGQKEALIAIGIDGQSYEDFATRNDVELGTVKSRVFRARQTLQAAA